MIQILLTISSIIFLIGFYIYVFIYIKNINTNSIIFYEKHYNVIVDKFMSFVIAYFIVIMGVLTIFQKHITQKDPILIIILIIGSTAINVAVSVFMVTMLYDKFLEVKVLQIQKIGNNNFKELVIERVFTKEIRYTVMTMTFINLTLYIISYFI